MDRVEVVGHRVLLKPKFDYEDDKTEWGFDLSVSDTHRREKAATVIGEVVSIGPMAWKAFDGDHPDWKPWAEVGDLVYFAKYGGKFITVNEEDFILINDEDLQAVIYSEDSE